MSKYNRTKLLPYGLRFIQGVVRGNTKFEIKGASFGVTQVTDNDVINAGKLPNIVGSIPIVAIDDDSLASQGVLGIELSFTQKSTGINHDVTLWDVQINGQQERDNQERPIAYTIAQQPETLTLSDPSFEFRLMVYVQVGDTDKVTINVNPDGMESRKEHQRDIQELVDGITQGYVVSDLKDKNGNQLYDHQGNKIKVKTAIVNTDKSLSILNRAADAKTTGDLLRALDQDLTGLNQKLYHDFTTKNEALDIDNLAKANADINRHQDQKIDELKIKTIELENNSRTIHLVGHNGTAISDHTSNSLVGLKQIMIVDSTLTNPNALANAKATGDAINTAYQQLSHAIGLIMAVLDSLDKNQVIIDIKNRLSALEEQKKETK
ncbi:hypothetical protein LABF186_07610 [Lactobacillus amylovorus subsp. animalium]|uniref:DUF2479 domain-containing protein n=1 Tax=Lactobacillus amylovorus subsp. animalium TaxID=3378536 RepID=A0ABD0C2Y6_LACAM|nr:hypothetical protein LABF186_07610 [Lactobacillus amylovorus]GMM16183.1 hypothetical protein LABF125_13170 [Lactobacillus amylovorus]